MKGLGIGGVVLGVGLALAGCSGERQQQPYLNAEPVAVQEVNRDSIKTETRNAIRQRGYVVQKGDTWAGIAGSNYFNYDGRFSCGEVLNPKEIGRALQDTNFALGRCGYVIKAILTDKPARTARDQYWNIPDVLEVKLPALRGGDTLFLPEILGGQWFYEPFIPEDSVDNRIREAEESREADAAYAKWYFDTHL